MQTFLRLIGYLRPYKGLVALSLLGVVAMSGLDIVRPLLVKLVIDQVIVGSDMTALPSLITTIVAVSIFHAGVFYGATYLRRYVGEQVVYDLRNALYHHLHYLEAKFHDTSRTGELMSRVTSDVHSIRRLMGFGLLMVVRVAARAVFVVGAAFFLSWKLTLIILVAAPFLYLTVGSFHRRIKLAFQAFQEQMATMTATLQENITGVRVVRSFGQESQEEGKFEAENRGVLGRTLDAVRIRANHAPVIEFWSGFSRALLLLAGGWFVINGEITIGTFVAFDGYLGRLMQPIRQLPNLIDMLGEGLASGDRIFEVLDTEPEIAESQKASPLHRPKGRVSFENVTVNYEFYTDPGTGGSSRMAARRRGRDRRLIGGHAERLPAIRSVNLTVEPGETVALLGRTGSGKSTLMHLINRTYDPDEGRVCLDGKDLRDLPLQELRRHVAVVPQESFLFSTTVFENIAYGRPDASLEEVIEAAEKAQAHHFIAELPDQYDTLIGERGAGLSGGQKQRLTIARAILLRPAILVIDDATSAVDMETEFLIWNALDDVVRNSTTFIVAQRLSTVRHVDRILVVKDGCIAEEGTHEELLAVGGVYRRMYDIQTEEAPDATPLRRSS